MKLKRIKNDKKSWRTCRSVQQRWNLNLAPVRRKAQYLKIDVSDTTPPLSADADLIDLRVDGIAVAGFAPANPGPYAASIPHSQTAVVITYTTSSADATVQVADDTNLAVGDNMITVIVTASYGDTKEYLIKVTRATAPHSSGGDGGSVLLPNEHERPDDSETPAFVFTDITEHWAEREIKRALSQGIINGYPDGTFKPNNPVTRAEFTMMLANALKLEGEDVVLAFTDKDQIAAWAKRAVVSAVQAGIITGYEDGSFRPHAPITRAEMALMIAKALNVSYDINTRTSFRDDEDIPKWARGAVEAIRTLDIVIGRGGNEFIPDGKATRAEAIVMLLRLLEVWEQQQFWDQPQ